MNIDFTAIITAIISLVSAIILYVLVPYLKKKRQEAEANMTAESRETLDYWLRVFISAAETVYEGSGLGGRKADWVILQLQKLGLAFDEETVRDAITGICRTLTAEGIINTPQQE